MACHSSGKGIMIENSEWIQSMSKPEMEEAVLDLYRMNTISTSICIADLGCSSGPKTLLVVSEIINDIRKRFCQQYRLMPEFQVFLNDLPGNDFNTVLKSLTAFYDKLRENGEILGRCFVAGVQGSFYGRLYPSKTLQIVHSSSSLRWLSQVPPGLDAKSATPLNKGKIYISKTSPPAVPYAYFTQFQRDFHLFLKSRSEELVPKGRMVLTFLGRKTSDPLSDDNCYLWDLLAQHSVTWF